MAEARKSSEIEVETTSLPDFTTIRDCIEKEVDLSGSEEVESDDSDAETIIAVGEDGKPIWEEYSGKDDTLLSDEEDDDEPTEEDLAFIDDGSESESEESDYDCSEDEDSDDEEEPEEEPEVVKEPEPTPEEEESAVSDELKELQEVAARLAPASRKRKRGVNPYAVYLSQISDDEDPPVPITKPLPVEEDPDWIDSEEEDDDGIVFSDNPPKRVRWSDRLERADAAVVAMEFDSFDEPSEVFEIPE